jgi:hypothetical protein
VSPCRHPRTWYVLALHGGHAPLPAAWACSWEAEAAFLHHAAGTPWGAAMPVLWRWDGGTWVEVPLRAALAGRADG